MEVRKLKFLTIINFNKLMGFIWGIWSRVVGIAMGITLDSICVRVFIKAFDRLSNMVSIRVSIDKSIKVSTQDSVKVFTMVSIRVIIFFKGTAYKVEATIQGLSISPSFSVWFV